jgi:LmbE family N-acetylglucosaminyl deacetylase
MARGRWALNWYDERAAWSRKMNPGHHLKQGAAANRQRRQCSLLYSVSLLPEQEYAVMVEKKARARIPPVVATIVRPVSTRLSRMEDLLIEMRHEQDVKLKKINRLQDQVDLLTEALKPRLARRQTPVANPRRRQGL